MTPLFFRRWMTLWIACLAPLTACGGADRPPAERSLALDLVEAPLRLRVVAGDGQVLIDVGEPAADGQAPSATAAIAVGGEATSYAMKAGAFEVRDKTTDIKKIERLVSTSSSTALRAGELLGSDGENLARVEIALIDAAHVSLRFDAPAGHDTSKVPLRLSFAWKTGEALAATAEHFVGLGAHTRDTDHRGRSVPLWVQEQGIFKLESDEDYKSFYESPDGGVPFPIAGTRHASYFPYPGFVSSRGYAVLVDSPGRVVVHAASNPQGRVRVEAGLPFTLHVFDGDPPTGESDGLSRPLRALSRMSAVTGRPRLPPPFAFAPWLDAIYSSENVRRVAKKLREEGIASGAIWSEDWRGGTEDGDAYALEERWEVDRTRYPDAEALASDLHEMGFKWLVYFNPFVYSGVPEWKETEPGGLLAKDGSGAAYAFAAVKLSAGKAGLVDLTLEAGRAWAKQKFAAAIALGADGWMGDYAEWLPTDAVLSAGSGLAWHQRYPVLWQQVQREALDAAKAKDGKDRLFFGRSGWIGSAPLADVIWAGDQSTDFDVSDGFPSIVPIAHGLGVAGISTYGHDIAGYQSVFTVATSKELFFRWTALGAYSPVMRTHHGFQAKLNWSWESDAETIAVFRDYARRHTALYPYLRRFAITASLDGIPILRTPGLVWPDAKDVWSDAATNGAWLLGPDLLVEPILEGGKTTRTAWIPPGTWHPAEGYTLAGEAPGATLEGPVLLPINASLTQIPVFARAGAVIVHLPAGVDTLSDEPGTTHGLPWAGARRVVDVYTPGAGVSLTTRFDETEAALTCEAAFEGTATGPRGEWEGDALPACKDAPQDATAGATPCAIAAGAATMLLLVKGDGAARASVNASSTATVRLSGGGAERVTLVRVHFAL